MLNVEVRRDAGYWSVYVNGLRTVERESFAVADRVAEFVRHPERQDNSESAEVAHAILKWTNAR